MYHFSGEPVLTLQMSLNESTQWSTITFCMNHYSIWMLFHTEYDIKGFLALLLSNTDEFCVIQFTIVHYTKASVKLFRQNE